MELRQELRRTDFVSSTPGKRRTPSKYVRWNDVFIYRTVESARRRSRRHRNLPYSLAVMAILCCAEMPPYVVVCVDDVCDPLFSAVFSPSSRPSSSSSFVPYAAIVSLSGGVLRKRETSAGTGGEGGGSGLSVFLPVVSSYPAGRGASFIMASLDYPMGNMCARQFPVDAPSRFSAFDASLFHTCWHGRKLNKRARAAVRVFNYRGRINWNSFRSIWCAKSLAEIENFDAHPLPDGTFGLRKASMSFSSSRDLECVNIIKKF